MASEESPPPLDPPMTTTLFHQRQRLLRCGMHSVNNLLQQDLATPQAFGEIAAAHVDIAGKGPILYRLGLGDYDANTVIAFLQDRAGCHVDFVDRRSPRDAIRRHLSDDNLKGFLVNTQRQRKWLPMQIVSSRHWVSVVWIRPQNEWYVVDSAKDKVDKIDDIIAYLEGLLGDAKSDANVMAVADVSGAKSTS